MGFSSHTRSISGSFIVGVAIDFFAIIFTATLSLLFHFNFAGLAFLIALGIFVFVWLTGKKVWHWGWLFVGVFFGFFVIYLIFAILAVLLGLALGAILSGGIP